MPIDAKTIQIFLSDGDPRGVRIAEITTRIVQAVQVPRIRLEMAAARPACAAARRGRTGSAILPTGRQAVYNGVCSAQYSDWWQ